MRSAVVSALPFLASLFIYVLLARRIWDDPAALYTAWLLSIIAVAFGGWSAIRECHASHLPIHRWLLWGIVAASVVLAVNLTLLIFAAYAFGGGSLP